MKRRMLLLGAGMAALLTVGVARAQPQSVEVIHWWTSGGEAAALRVLKQDLQQQGVTWKDAPVAGGGGAAAMTTLRARVTAGSPPDASQMLGYAIQDWAQLGVLADLTPIATKDGWDAAIPKALWPFSKYDGKWIAAPVNFHSTNWIWVNTADLDKLGMKPPTTWDELVTVLDKAKAAGMIPLALGGQAWQEATIFDSIVLTTGGPDFYKKSMMELDPAALDSPTMLKVFQRMATLRGFVDPNFSGRDWNLATAMVIKGDALMQIMGDWAKGEFVNAHKVAGQDFGCYRFPGTQGAVTFNTDQFVFFKKGKDLTPAQAQMAADIESKSFQSAFNVIKGSVPARTDVPDTAFDACGKKGIADLKEADAHGTLLGSMAHGYANPPAVQNAMYDVITRHFNGQLKTEDAPKALADAVAAAK
ncbi:MAG TPA: ABC transporter substrate-binding protein [Acetobacteraceae bacterium]|nr:ABC transporter substrate-binding protein [Acetobacteraceae bacterium]